MPSHIMYPDWPRSDADLVPLPLCDGPKLKAFDFHGHQDIEFLEFLGMGTHSNVFKVKIHDKIYALKLFNFVHTSQYAADLGPTPKNDDEAWSVLYQSSDTFSAECRAFGRLHETGREDLAIKCFGYILLDEKLERIMMDKFSSLNLHFIGSQHGPRKWWHRFPGTEENPGRRPPLRGILKECGESWPVLTDGILRRYLRSIRQLHQLGIVHLDVAQRQLINGKHADFTTAITTPHFAINAELSPHLSPEMLRHQEYNVFWFCMKDYFEFDYMVLDTNELREEDSVYKTGKKWIRLSTFAFPQQADAENDRTKWFQNDEEVDGPDRGRPSRYNFRPKPDRQRLWAYVDPRKYDWRKSTGNGSDRRDRNHLDGRPAGISKKSLPRPQRWYFDREEIVPMKYHEMRGEKLGYFLRWTYRDGKFIPTPVERQFL